MRRNPIFFTSDTHYFHENSIKFDDRPFSNIEEMHKTLIKNYNHFVPTYGTCYFLGDFGFSSVENLKSIISQLNGQKILILGNHDKRGYNAYFDIGFNLILNSAKIIIANQPVTLSHCPLRGVFREDVTGMNRAVEGENWHGESRHFNYSVPNEGQYHLHGHSHLKSELVEGKTPLKTNRQWDIGVVGNKYSPVSISQVESWIMKTLKEEK